MPNALLYRGNFRQAPRWAADFVSGREYILPVPAKLDPTLFTSQAGPLINVTTIAAQNATSVLVTALTAGQYVFGATLAVGSVLIPAGKTLDFGGAKFARLTADAKVGDTTLTVAALPTALAVGDKAVYSPAGMKLIPSGTFIGRTYAERDAATAFGPAAVTDDEAFLTPFEIIAYDNDPVDCELYRHGLAVKENYLPDYTALYNTAVDEVATVAISGSLSGGSFNVKAVVGGVQKTSSNIAYNANTAAIQTGYDSVYGASKVVVGGTGTVASHTVTFSGTGVTGLPADPFSIDGSNLTGFTGSTITPTTEGGTPLRDFLRTKYRCIVGVD